MTENKDPTAKENKTKTANKPRSTRKLCPITHDRCLRHECALWIEVRKQPVNPLYTLHFEGCGLIQNLPWTLKENLLPKRKTTK